VSLRIEQLETLDALERIEPEWRGLWERDAAATPFEGPDWVLPWTRHIWNGGRLRVLAVWNDTSLAALAPFFHWGYGGRPEIIRVSLLGAGTCGHLGMIAAPSFAAEGARLVLEHLTACRDEWHLCDLHQLRPGSPLLRAEFPEGLSGRDAPCGARTVLALPGTVDGLPAENRVIRDGRIEFVRAKRAADVGPLMGELFRFSGTRLPETERTRRFHLEAAGRFAARDMLRLCALRCGGRTIAVQYSLRRGERHFYCLSGSDPAHARSSPASVLLAEAVRQAIEEGAREIDFPSKHGDLKYRWRARDRVNRKLLIARSAGYVRKVA
jgi:CelD/BcsL family acetyltransferase involved in cellulose biosynthesis